MTLNYNIHFEERCGRMLIAARDIAAGEVIFQVKAIVIDMSPHDTMTHSRTHRQPLGPTTTRAPSV